jgi:Xaa-Pro aminopeptidase
MHPTLLIGPADWDAARLPRAEFDARIAALWQDQPRAAGAVVYGDSRDHAALAYLTHFSPKLEAGLALIPRTGAPRLLIGGGVNMLPAAKPLTFVEDLAPLRDAPATVARWAGSLPERRVIVLIGGDAMPYVLRRALDAALPSDVVMTNGDDRLRARMRIKRPRELAALRTAAATLAVAVAALEEAFRAGQGVTDCVLAAEHAALHRGAQDVRSLFSLDCGLGLRPFDVPVSTRCDPLQAYLAVRQGGYWTDAFVRLRTTVDALQDEVRRRVQSMIGLARPGASGRELAAFAQAGGGKFRAHPLTAGVFGSSIGLALDELPMLARDGDATLEAGGVYSLRTGLRDEKSGAIASAMVAVKEDDCEVLWPPGNRTT